MAKWWITDAAEAGGDQCVQLHGGCGYMLAYPVAKACTDCRVQTIYGRTTEVMKEILGRSLGVWDRLADMDVRADVEARVRAWDRRVLEEAAEEGWEVPEPIRLAGSVLREPASEADVVALEERLGQPLPPSYRAFLLLSDGAWAQPGYGLVEVRDGRSGILRASEVGWFRDLEPSWIDAYTDQMDDTPEHQPITHLRYTLMIASEQDGGTVLLDPLQVDADGEWDAWFFANWAAGEQTFGSFPNLLAWATAKEDAPSDLDEKIRQAVALVNDRGADVRERDSAICHLANDDDPANHLPMLLRVAGDLSEMIDVRQTALQVLWDVDDPRALAVLVAAATDPEPRIRCSAVPHLAAHPDADVRAVAVEALARPEEEDFVISFTAPRGKEALYEAWQRTGRLRLLAAVAACYDKRAAAPLAAALADPATPDEDRFALWMQARRATEPGDPVMVAALLRAHELGGLETSWVARKLLELDASDEATALLLVNVHDDPYGLVAPMVAELARQGQPDAAAALVAAFQAKPTAAGAKALGAVDTPQARAALLAQADMPRLAKAVVAALEKMSSEPARTALAELAGRGGPAREPAAAALSRKDRAAKRGR